MIWFYQEDGAILLVICLRYLIGIWNYNSGNLFETSASMAPCGIWNHNIGNLFELSDSSAILGLWNHTVGHHPGPYSLLSQTALYPGPGAQLKKGIPARGSCTMHSHFAGALGVLKGSYTWMSGRLSEVLGSL